MPTRVCELSDFDWRTAVVVACDKLDDAGAVALCRLTLRMADNTHKRFELTSEELDDVIDSLATIERAVAAEADKAADEAAAVAA
jgi:hypothetical protein